MTPDDEATNTVSDGDAPNRGARQYSVSGLDDTETYDVALFDAADVTVNDGIVSFADDGDTDHADLTVDSTGGVIEVVNGSANAQDPDTNHVEVSPVNGTISFTIDSTEHDSVIPVIWVDEDTTEDDALDLDANDEPTEPFGIGGQKNWQPEEATTGDTFSGDVVEADTAENWYTLDTGTDGVPDVLVNYETNDSFLYSSGTFSDVVLTATEFEEFLSEGDTLTVTGYNPGGEDFGAATTHDIDNDIPAAPENLTATTSDADEDGFDDTVHLDWDAPSNPDVDSYIVERADADAEGNFGAFVDVTADGSFEDPDGTAAETEWTEQAGEGDYLYRVRAVNGSGDQGPPSNEVEVSLAGEELGNLLSENAVVTNEQSLLGETSADDEWQIGFNQPVHADVETTGQIAVEDGDGDAAVVDCSGATTCALNTQTMEFEGETYAPNELLTVTLGAALTDLEYPLEIINSDNVYAADDTTNTWNLADSLDTTLEVDETAGATDAQAPEATDATFTTVTADPQVFGDEAGDELVVTYDETVEVADGDTVTIDADGDDATTGDQETYTCDATADAAGQVTCSESGGVVTFTTTASTATTVTIVDGTSTVEDTTGITDAAGNEAVGYPEVINDGS